jgi:N4-gp56 family major capsid protein
MADAYTQLSSVSWDTAAYNALAYYSLRDQLIFDQFADVRPTHQTHVGSSVTFTIAADLAAATTALTETADVDAVAISDSTVVVTPAEYGNAVLSTAKLRLTSYVEIDPIVANLVGYNAGISVDTIARTPLEAGTNVVYATGGATTPTSRTTVQTEDIIAGDDVRYVVAKLRAANVMPYGMGYVGVIHPDISYDFRGAVPSGSTGWRDPHVYSSPEGIFRGEIGMYEGVRFIENPRVKVWTDASNGSGSTGTIDVYQTYIMGQQALAKAYSSREGYGPNPQVVLGPVTDKLRRFVPIGWKHFVGYGIFRQASLYRIESASSIGTNT